MKQKIFSVTTLLLLLLAAGNLLAQRKDSVRIIVIGDSAIYKYGREITSYGDTIQIRMRSGYKKGDTIYLRYNDLLKKNDTIYTRKNLRYASSDSLYKRSNETYKRTDSLYRIQQKKYREQLLRQSKQNRRIDSLRVTAKLDRLKTDLQSLQVATSVKNNTRQKKEISIEINTDKNTTVFIRNLSRKIIIKTTTDNTVKLVTDIDQDAADERKNIDWEKMLNIDFSKDKNAITIQSAGSRTVTMSGGGSSTLALSQSYSSVTSSGFNNKSPLLVYIPVNAKLNIENSYNAIEIMNDVKEVKALLRNTTLKMKDADLIIINNKYGALTTGNIKDATIDVVNCKLNCGDIDKLVINSKYSTVTFNNSGVIDIKSTSDQYNIEKVKDVQVTKSFGKMNISTLTNSIIMVGSSADLKVSTIAASARLIQIDNKYADIKLPVNLLKNYTINLDGNNNRLLTPFENTDNKNLSDSLKPYPASFTKIAGDTNKPFTAIKLNCGSCSVDLR